MLFIGGLLLYIVLFVWIPVPGIRPLCVTSGSMEPEIKEGDMVYIRKCQTADVEIGDIIAFETGNNQLVLHRVVDMKTEEVITKGDANDYNDFAPVISKNIRGKLVLVLPECGRWYKTISSVKTGTILGVYIVCRLTFSVYYYIKERFFI